MDFHLRPARSEDRAALGALKLRASLAANGTHAEALAALPEARDVPEHHLPHAQVALAADLGLAGFAVVLARPEGDAELEDLFVDPDLQRSGAGAALVAWAERHAAALGARALHVTASRQAEPFYRACGFTPTGEVMTQFELAPTLMKRLRA